VGLGCHCIHRAVTTSNHPVRECRRHFSATTQRDLPGLYVHIFWPRPRVTADDGAVVARFGEKRVVGAANSMTWESWPDSRDMATSCAASPNPLLRCGVAHVQESTGGACWLTRVETFDELLSAPDTTMVLRLIDGNGLGVATR